MSGRSRQGGGHHAGGADNTGGPPWHLTLSERNEANSYPYPTHKRRDDTPSSLVSRPVVEEVYYYDHPPLRPSRSESSSSHFSGTGMDGFVSRPDDMGSLASYSGGGVGGGKDVRPPPTKVKAMDPQRHYGKQDACTTSTLDRFSLSLSGSSKVEERGGWSTDPRWDKGGGGTHPEPHEEPERRSDVIIEIAPGVQVVLRGSQETWEAIKDDFYTPCQCIGCDTSLFVIQDAAYVLCPRCYSVVPLEGEFIDRAVSGVGMGFTIEDLMQWQQEILHGRNYC